jgi:hypothetical protein
MTDPVLAASQRLQELFGLSPEAAVRAVSEVADAFDVDVDEFIAGRHQQLHAKGINNSAAFQIIQQELSRLRFRAPPMTERQLRRRIYW